jgi:hypothetical protein
MRQVQYHKLVVAGQESGQLVTRQWSAQRPSRRKRSGPKETNILVCVGDQIIQRPAVAPDLEAGG